MTLLGAIQPPLQYADDLSEVASLLKTWAPGSTAQLDAARLTLKRVHEETSDWLYALAFVEDHQVGPQVVMLIARLEAMAGDIRRVMAPAEGGADAV